MSKLYEEQMAQIVKKNLNKTWIENLLKVGSPEDREAADEWLKGGRASLEKSFAEVDSGIKSYLALDADDRATMDPDVVKLGMKVSKAYAVTQTLVQSFLEKTKWPATSKMRDKLKAEVNSLKTLAFVYKTMDPKGNPGAAVLKDDGKGGAMTAKQRVTPSMLREDDQRVMKARRLLVQFEAAQEKAIAQKQAYTQAKLEAKKIFAEYEAWMAQISPSYKVKKIDWNVPDAWEKVSEDMELSAHIKALMDKQ